MAINKSFLFTFLKYGYITRSMAYVYILILLVSWPAQAGFFTRLCERLVMDDPTQFELVSDEWLAQATRPLEIREQWNRITKPEAQMLELLRVERRKRDTIAKIPLPSASSL